MPEDDIRAANVNQEEAGAMPDVDDTAIAMSASLADAEQVLANSVACCLLHMSRRWFTQVLPNRLPFRYLNCSRPCWMARLPAQGPPGQRP